MVTIKEGLSTLISKVYSMINCAINDVDRQGEGRNVLDDYREKSMKNNEKIEKELFLEQEPCPEQIQDKKTTIDIFDKEIIKWKPMDNNVRKGVDKNELAFKCIVAMLIVIAPFILFYELGESFWFRCSSKKRKEEFKQMERERAKYAKKHSPKEERNFYRNNDRCVIHYSTSQDIYPKCDISIWVPETKVNDYPRVPWMDTMELYSIKMPYTFHSYWADGYVSDLAEADWLADFKMKWGLVNAISVINYDSNGYETIFRSRKAETFFLDTFPFDDEERTPLECFVELLTDKKPMDGLEYEKVLYRFVPMGEFRLERKSYDRLTGSSRKKLGRILDEYGLSKFRFV